MENDFNIDDLIDKLNSPEMSDTLNSLLSSNSASPKLDLLDALKPYVNERRQKKIDQCEKFVSMINVITLMNKINGDENGL